MKIYFALFILFAAGASVAANPSSPAVPGKARIVVISEPLGGMGITADVDVNGKRVASVGVDEPYSDVFAPGPMVVTVRGGKAEFKAEANKEYLLEVALIPSRGGFFAFGLVGAMSMGSYTITLKETRETPATAQQSESAGESPAPAKQVLEQVRPLPQAQIAPVRSERPQEKAAISPSSSAGNDSEMQRAQRLVVAEPSNDEAWRDLATQYQNIGELDKAIRSYQEALRLAPNDANTLEALGVLYAKVNQKDKLREIWERLAKIDKVRADKLFSAYILP